MRPLPDASGITTTVISQPSLMVFETNLYEETTRVMDKPPVYPDVEISSYKGINNQILFRMRDNAGMYKEKMQFIEDGDLKAVESIKDAQKIVSFDKTPVWFNSDESNKNFQVFRTDKMPRRYQDFRGKMRRSLQFPFTSFVDKVTPNKVYYYTFRAIDHHDHLSNPTFVYEVQMVDNDGAYYLIVKPIDLKTIKEKHSFIGEFKRYLNIRPQTLQTILNFKKSGIKEFDTAIGKKITLGVLDESIFEKIFKIRITSKKTGKSIDLNVRWDYEMLRSLKIKNISPYVKSMAQRASEGEGRTVASIVSAMNKDVAMVAPQNGQLATDASILADPKRNK